MAGPPPSISPRPLRSALVNPTERAERAAKPGYRKRSVSVPTPPPPDLAAHGIFTAKLGAATAKAMASATPPATSGLRAPPAGAPSSRAKYLSNISKVGGKLDIGARKWTPIGTRTFGASDASSTPSLSAGTAAASRAPTAQHDLRGNDLLQKQAEAENAAIEQKQREVAALQERVAALRAGTANLTASLPNLPASSPSAVSMFPPHPSAGLDARSPGTATPGNAAGSPRTLGEALQLIVQLRGTYTSRIKDLEARLELAEAENRGLRHRNENLEDDVRTLEEAARNAGASAHSSGGSGGGAAARMSVPEVGTPHSEDWDDMVAAAERRSIEAEEKAAERLKMLEELEKRRAAAAPVPFPSAAADGRYRHGPAPSAGASAAAAQQQRVRTASWGSTAPVSAFGPGAASAPAIHRSGSVGPGPMPSPARGRGYTGIGQGSGPATPTYFRRPFPHHDFPGATGASGGGWSRANLYNAATDRTAYRKMGLA